MMQGQMVESAAELGRRSPFEVDVTHRPRLNDARADHLNSNTVPSLLAPPVTVIP
jgi:hypothetical protein